MKRIISLIIIVLFCISLSSCSNQEQIIYTVTFNSQGGSVVSSQKVIAGSRAVRPMVERDGYYLKGWYTSSLVSDERKWDFDIDRVRDNITLYAQWIPKTEEEEVTAIYITVNSNKLEVTLTQNSAVDALIEILKLHDITYIAHPYGGFEIVGNIGQTLPANNEQIMAQTGDVMLYQGNSIVIFYGENEWLYTRIGRINGYSASELRALLSFGNGSIEVKLSLQ